MSDATLIAQAATELGAQLEDPSMSDNDDACPDDPLEPPAAQAVINQREETQQ